MGKNKHKKHHKHDALDCTEVRGQGLKIILKVGGVVGTVGGVGGSGDTPSTSSAGIIDIPPDKSHKKKKKKKEKKKDKDKKHRHHHKEKRKHYDLEEGSSSSITPKPIMTSMESIVAPVGGGAPSAAASSPVPSIPVPNVQTSISMIRNEDPQPPPAKKIAIDPTAMAVTATTPTGASTTENFSHKQSPPHSPSIRIKSPGRASSETKRPLTKLLEYILPLLEKRDSNSFFAFPVSDKIAPGYSDVIKEPMDFSTMRSKLEAGEYRTLDMFKRDFELMCTNAMTYNQQETVYYKAAKKLLILGQRVLTLERLRPLREHFPFMKDITPNELGFEAEEWNREDLSANDVKNVIEDIREQVKRPLGRFEAIPDDLTPAEILEQAKNAAKEVATKAEKKKTQLGFLHKNPDGTTSLSFLTGGDGIIPGTDNERPVSLGPLIGKVKQGTGVIQGFREDRRNIAKAVHPLYYGAFSSHGPSYDSTFANLTKEETELVYSTYGDEVGVQYAESIMNFGRNCDYAMFIVDHLLDILTGNEHRKTSKYIEQEKNLRKEEELLNQTFKPVLEGQQKKDIDFDSLKSLNDEGIDMSFLDNLKAEYEKPSSEPEESETGKLLEQNAELIHELKEVQHQRLSAKPPPHFSQMAKPNQKEEQLAEKIRMNLTEITKTVAPGQVVPDSEIKNMLGIPLNIKN